MPQIYGRFQKLVVFAVGCFRAYQSSLGLFFQQSIFAPLWSGTHWLLDWRTELPYKNNPRRGPWREVTSARECATRKNSVCGKLILLEPGRNSTPPRTAIMLTVRQ